MRVVLATLVLGALATSAGAQVHEHSSTSPEKLGTVHFPTSCKPAAQPEFNRSVALLHSFEFGAAIKGFQSVLAADSSCAMAYWGLAMSRWSNPMAAGGRSPDQLARGLAYVDSAVQLEANASDRERGYIDAVGALYRDFEHKSQAARVSGYERAMNSLVEKQPADTEAKIFHAISLVAAASPQDKTYTNQRKAGAILQSLWEKQPNHPGLAHYLIHTYDYPALASKGEAAAREYSVIAPSAAHALHMPSHIFTRTGEWRASIEGNRKSMDAALSTASIAEALHAADYEEYAYLQLRQDVKAKEILDKLPSLSARFDPKAITGAAPGSAGVFALAAIPARYALEREAWEEAARLEAHASPFPWTEAMTYFARAIGAARMKDFSKAHAAVDSLSAIRDRLVAPDDAYWREQVAIQQLGAEAWVNLGEGHLDSALAKMREATAREDATEKSAVTPGPLYPASEMLGDMLMQVRKPREALAEYQKTLTREPNRYRSLAGAERAARAAGDATTARRMKEKITAQIRVSM